MNPEPTGAMLLMYIAAFLLYFGCAVLYISLLRDCWYWYRQTSTTHPVLTYGITLAIWPLMFVFFTSWRTLEVLPGVLFNRRDDDWRDLDI